MKLSHAFRNLGVSAAVIAGLGFGVVDLNSTYMDSWAPVPAIASEAGYADGAYEASGRGIGGNVPVVVAIEGGVITSVEVGDNAETVGIGSRAIEQLPALIVGANGIDGVDGISGATITSNAIFKAVGECLEQAKSSAPVTDEEDGGDATVSPQVSLIDGLYEAEHRGMGGKVPVTVTVFGGKVVAVMIGENAETVGIGSKAIDRLPARIVEANGTDGVDGISGATITSTAILTAVDECIAQATPEPVELPETPAVSLDEILDSMSLAELESLRSEIDQRIVALGGTVVTTSEPGAPSSALPEGVVYAFDGFHIVVNGEPTLVSGSGGKSYVRVPLLVTNNSGETGGINMFYVNYYGSKGTSLDVPYFSFDDELAGGSDMRNGATMEQAAYLEYDGNGEYYIVLDDIWNTEVEICIPVNF